MIPLKHPLELLRTAMRWYSVNDKVSAMAYLKMAQKALFELQYTPGLPPKDFAILRESRNYTSYACEGHDAMVRDIRVLLEFWSGFDDGQRGRVLPYKASAHWTSGYRFGKNRD